MTANRRTGFAVVFAVLLTTSMGVLGVHAPAAEGTQVGETRASGVQGTELTLAATGSPVIVPGQNVTANFTLRNTGESAAEAPAIRLVSVPDEWEVVEQSSPEGVNWSEAERAWISTRSLDAGESVSVSVTLRLPTDAATGQYYVSARASDAAGSSAEAVETFPVGRADDRDLGLEASVDGSAAPGENVTMDVTLRNRGDVDSVAPAVGLTLPSGWTVVEQSAPEGVNYSAANAEWISAESLSPGESVTVSAVLRPANDTPAGQYFVSVRGSDAGNRSTATTATITVTDAEAMDEEMGGEEETEAQNDSENVSATFLSDGEPLANVTLEVADSPEERAEGLMFRESLPENHGMVFVYGDAEPRSFWMKNTLIPLDMIFVAENGTVVNVEHADPEPNASDSELERYRSDGPAKYVIEMEQGFANETGIEAGTEVEFDVEGNLEPANETDES